MIAARRIIVSFGCVIALILSSAPGAANLYRPPAVPTEGSNRARSAPPAARINVVVELEREPLAVHERADPALRDKLLFESNEAQSYRSLLEEEHDAFKSRAAVVAPSLRVNTDLHVLLNAVSLEISASELNEIKELPEVRRIRPARQYSAAINRSVPAVSAPAIWEQLGGQAMAGKGMKIAILDSGIDISNPLFSDADFVAPPGFPRGDVAFTNDKVIVAKVFLPLEGSTPADELGHGTHVAGIAAGNRNTPSPIAVLSGVAPQAYLGNYRVLDSTGTGRDDYITRALEEAVEDGFDVINLSFGGDPGTGLGLLDEAVERAVASGSIVVVAAGNDGRDGEGTITSPGVAPSAITVGATTNPRMIGPGANIMLTGPQPLPLIESTIGEVDDHTVSLISTIGPLPIRIAGPISAQSRGCMGLTAESVSDSIVLVERGTCRFSDKVRNAETAGAAAVIIFNQDGAEAEDGGENLLFMDVSGTRIPSVFIRRNDGLAIRDWLSTHPETRATVTPRPLIEVPSPGDFLAQFSSRGPSSNGDLKPDLCAPGDPIYSGAIRNGRGRAITDPSGFAASSGTSQAAPHVAGAAALLWQMHPSWTPGQVKSALMCSAMKIPLDASAPGAEAGVLDGGAGRIDLKRAATVSATLSPASLSFGVLTLRKVNARSVIRLEITNVTEYRNRFRIIVEQANPGNGFSMTPKVRSVLLERGEKATVKIKVLTIAGVAQRRDYTGHIVVTDEQGQALRAPYWVRVTKK